MRGNNLIKLLKTLDLLSKPEGTTISEMEEELGIDRRSVYRQIQLIQDLGFPLYDDKVPFEKRKKWKLMDGYLKRLPNIKVPNIELSLSEMVALYLLKSEGKVYKGTDIEKAIDSAWFSADQARYSKERKWAKEQKITNQPDGSIILEMKTSGWWDVKKWVLSFGAETKVLEPKGLREEVMKELKAANNRYSM